MQNLSNQSLKVFKSGTLGNSKSILVNEEPPLFPTIGITPLPDRKEISINQYLQLQAEVEADGGLLPTPEFSHFKTSSKRNIPDHNIDALYPAGINPNTFCEDCE